MRLDNYIHDHGMRFPDIVDFPECEAPGFPDDVDTVDIDAAFDASLQTLDLNEFQSALGMLRQRMADVVPLDNDAEACRQTQDARIVSAASIFMDSTRAQTSRDDIAPNNVYNLLREQGYFAVGVDTAPLVSMLRPQIDELLSREDNDAAPHFYDRAIQFRANDHQPLFATLTDFFNRTGVIDGATKYNQNGNLEIDMIALHVATPTDTHHYQTFRDCTTSTRLISLHTDPKYNLIKCLIYLNDVDKDGGPFSYVPTSNRWWYDETERIFAYGNSTGNYLDSPAARRAATAAPSRYRRNAIVGRLIPDDTPLSDMLLKSLHEFTTDEANCIVFDPLGLHRGGLCNQGKRVALQILLRPHG